MKKLPPLELKNCLICTLPIQRTRGQGVTRYLSVKTHGGECGKQYKKMMQVGFYSMKLGKTNRRFPIPRKS